MARVLVTGGSGFLGSWCILGLLAQGHSVSATLRSRSRAADLTAMLDAGGAGGSPVAIFEADLTQDAGWSEAVAGCDYVLHIASPFGGSAPDDQSKLIAAAKDGALRVLRAARDADVRRVVLTSSFAAVGYGHPVREAPFTELDWTDVQQPDVMPYIRSKTLAERAAWDFMGEAAGGLELSVINPVGIFGPVLGPDYSSSIDIIRTMLTGGMPAAPDIHFGLVDVRDVADLHISAMTSSHAAGERFLAVAGEPMSMLEISQVMRRDLGEAAAKAPATQLPDAVVLALAEASEPMRQMAPQLGKRRRCSNAKARDQLGWAPRPNEEVIVATAQSLIDQGLVGG